jgi:hypothetical protein
LAVVAAAAPAAAEAGAKGDAAGNVVAACRRSPHCPQNRAPGLQATPQAGHAVPSVLAGVEVGELLVGGVSTAPQPLQHLAPSRLTVAQT